MNGRTSAENFKRAAARLGIAFVLLGWPAASAGAFAAESPQGPQRPSDVTFFAEYDHSAQSQRDQDQAARDREQAKKDAEQAKRDAEQERLDRMQELYDEGRGYLDEESYRDAARAFTKLAEMHGAQADAALYWLAYAQNKLGKRDAALSTIAEMKRSYPQSRWTRDAVTLEF